MGFSVELAFDEQSNDRLSQLWTDLQRIYGKPQRTELGVRPHISLAVFPRGEPSSLRRQVEALAGSIPPFTIHLSHVDHIPTSEGVVYLAPAPSPELNAAHQLFHALEHEGCSRYYLPGQWVPHCTVATDVPSEQIASVRAACVNSEVFQEVLVRAVCGVEYRPATERYRFALIGP